MNSVLEMVHQAIVWANANKRVDVKKPLVIQDVAYVALNSEEFASLSEPSYWDNWIQAHFKRSGEVLFRLSDYNLPKVERVDHFINRIAWRYTGNTAKMFNWEHHKVKEVDEL